MKKDPSIDDKAESKGDSGVVSDDQLQKKKLESLGVLASSVAHDLNNILTGVLGHISYLRLSLPETHSNQESVLAIEDGARRAAAITQKILEFARGEEVELGSVNLSLVAAAGLNLLRASLPPDIALNLVCGKEDVFVFGDESQLSQLVMNLTVNARDALPNGGRIELALEKEVIGDNSKLDEIELEAGEYAKLSVRDNGIGIPSDVQHKIFERFFTTKDRHGTGIGLATVYSIVKAHRGAIRVKSKEGQGTVFDVYLPLSESTSQGAAPGKSQKELQAAHNGASGQNGASAGSSQYGIPGGRERILVVDDEEAVRIVVQRSLELLGYEVVIATNGIEALESFEQLSGQFSLVILDMIMPQMPGDELFYRLKDLDSAVPVLIASGYASDERTRAVLDDGALGYIQKPFAVEELAVEVRRCLDASPCSR